MRSEHSLKISVVIPIYNIESYITQCVHTVQNQSWRNIEIVLVDDGSTDNSPQICDELQKKDERIVVIHKANGGLSDARNVGVQSATGDYILFLDGDDYWDDSQALEKLINRVSKTKVDVLNFSYKKYFEDTEEFIPYFNNAPAMPDRCTTKEQQVEYLTKKRLYIASACNKLIRRSLFDSQMMFVSGIYSEDIEWCVRLLSKAESMDFICENFYCYRQRKDSITHTITQKKCEDLCNNIIGCIRYASDMQEPTRTWLYRYTAYQFGTFFVVQARADMPPVDCICELSQYKWLLNYHGSDKKLIALYVVSKTIGYERTCKLLRKFYQTRKRFQ